MSVRLQADAAPALNAFADLSATIRDWSTRLAARREKQVVLFFKPRPWWMPRFVQRWLLRELTTVVIADYVPIASSPIRLSPWPVSFRPEEHWRDSLRYAYDGYLRTGPL